MRIGPEGHNRLRQNNGECVRKLAPLTLRVFQLQNSCEAGRPTKQDMMPGSTTPLSRAYLRVIPMEDNGHVEPSGTPTVYPASQSLH